MSQVPPSRLLSRGLAGRPLATRSPDRAPSAAATSDLETQLLLPYFPT